MFPSRPSFPAPPLRAASAASGDFDPESPRRDTITGEVGPAPFPVFPPLPRSNSLFPSAAGSGPSNNANSLPPSRLPPPPARPTRDIEGAPSSSFHRQSGIPHPGFLGKIPLPPVPRTATWQGKLPTVNNNNKNTASLSRSASNAATPTNLSPKIGAMVEDQQDVENISEVVQVSQPTVGLPYAPQRMNSTSPRMLMNLALQHATSSSSLPPPPPVAAATTLYQRGDAHLLHHHQQQHYQPYSVPEMDMSFGGGGGENNNMNMMNWMSEAPPSGEETTQYASAATDGGGGGGGREYEMEMTMMMEDTNPAAATAAAAAGGGDYEEYDTHSGAVEAMKKLPPPAVSLESPIKARFARDGSGAAAPSSYSYSSGLPALQQHLPARSGALADRFNSGGGGAIYPGMMMQTMTSSDAFAHSSVASAPLPPPGAFEESDAATAVVVVDQHIGEDAGEWGGVSVEGGATAAAAESMEYEDYSVAAVGSMHGLPPPPPPPPPPMGGAPRQDFPVFPKPLVTLRANSIDQQQAVGSAQSGSGGGGGTTFRPPSVPTFGVPPPPPPSSGSLQKMGSGAFMPPPLPSRASGDGPAGTGGMFMPGSTVGGTSRVQTPTGGTSRLGPPQHQMYGFKQKQYSEESGFDGGVSQQEAKNDGDDGGGATVESAAAQRQKKNKQPTKKKQKRGSSCRFFFLLTCALAVSTCISVGTTVVAVTATANLTHAAISGVDGLVRGASLASALDSLHPAVHDLARHVDTVSHTEWASTQNSIQCLEDKPTCMWTKRAFHALRVAAALAKDALQLTVRGAPTAWKECGVPAIEFCKVQSVLLIDQMKGLRTVQGRAAVVAAATESATEVRQLARNLVNWGHCVHQHLSQSGVHSIAHIVQPVAGCWSEAMVSYLPAVVVVPVGDDAQTTDGTTTATTTTTTTTTNGTSVSPTIPVPEVKVEVEVDGGDNNRNNATTIAPTPLVEEEVEGVVEESSDFVEEENEVDVTEEKEQAEEEIWLPAEEEQGAEEEVEEMVVPPVVVFEEESTTTEVVSEDTPVKEEEEEVTEAVVVADEHEEEAPPLFEEEEEEKTTEFTAEVEEEEEQEEEELPFALENESTVDDDSAAPAAAAAVDTVVVEEDVLPPVPVLEEKQEIDEVADDVIDTGVDDDDDDGGGVSNESLETESKGEPGDVVVPETVSAEAVVEEEQPVADADGVVDAPLLDKEEEVAVAVVVEHGPSPAPAAASSLDEKKTVEEKKDSSSIGVVDTLKRHSVAAFEKLSTFFNTAASQIKPYLVHHTSTALSYLEDNRPQVMMGLAAVAVTTVAFFLGNASAGRHAASAMAAAAAAEARVTAEPVTPRHPAPTAAAVAGEQPELTSYKSARSGRRSPSTSSRDEGIEGEEEEEVSPAKPVARRRGRQSAPARLPPPSFDDDNDAEEEEEKTPAPVVARGRKSTATRGGTAAVGSTSTRGRSRSTRGRKASVSRRSTVVKADEGDA